MTHETSGTTPRWLGVAAGLLGLAVLAGAYTLAYVAPPHLADSPVWMIVALVALTGCLWAIHTHPTTPEGHRLRRMGRNPLWWPVLWLWGVLVLAVALSALSFLPGSGLTEMGGFLGVVVTIGVLLIGLIATVMMFVWVGLGSIALFVWSTWSAIPPPRPAPVTHETSGSGPA